MKELKQIRFKGKVRGHGIVNYDGDHQKFMINELRPLGLLIPMADGKYADCVSYAKRELFVNSEGKTEYLIKISSDCLRNAIFKKDVEHVNPSIAQVESLFCSYVTSPVALLRGYQFSIRNDKIEGFSGYTRTSPVTITPAVQVRDKNGNLAKSMFELCSASGSRNDTSVFYKETVGEIEYEFDGVIDLKRLQFISTDPVFDRISFENDYVVSGRIENMMKRHYGSKALFKSGWFSDSSKYIGTSYCESGILLDRELQEELIRYFLKNLLSVRIERAKAYAEVYEVEVAPIYDLLEDTEENIKDEYIKIDQDVDVDFLKGDYHTFYTESTEEDFKKREEFIKEYKGIMAKRKEEKAAKKKERQERKNSKNEEEK